MLDVKKILTSSTFKKKKKLHIWFSFACYSLLLFYFIYMHIDDNTAYLFNVTFLYYSPYYYSLNIYKKATFVSLNFRNKKHQCYKHWKSTASFFPSTYHIIRYRVTAISCCVQKKKKDSVILKINEYNIWNVISGMMFQVCSDKLDT